MYISLEMGDIATDFRDYKESYNMAGKILKSPAKFLIDTGVMIGALQNRLQEEDLVLYPLIQE